MAICSEWHDLAESHWLIDCAARLLAADATNAYSLLANANATGPSTLRLHAWDRTIGQAGGIGNFTEFAQFPNFQYGFGEFGVNVLAVNDAPNYQCPECGLRPPSARHRVLHSQRQCHHHR